MAEQTRAIDVRKANALIHYQGRAITISFEDVKRHICPDATDQEIVMFLNVTQSLNLNPWAKEVYLVKYSKTEPASTVIAEESYLKAAEQCSEFDGLEAGVIVKDKQGNISYPEGTFYELENELVGGWASIHRKDRGKPFYITVSFKECSKHTKEGNLTRYWESMPSTMIRKVALSRALKEAFPSRLGGMITDAEWEDITERKAFEKGGKPNFELFYAKVKNELGLTSKQAHDLLGVAHFSTLFDKGWTTEKIWDNLVLAIKTGHTIDASSGEILEGSFEELPSMEQREKEKEQAGKKAKRNPADIKDTVTLLRACFEDFGLQPPDVYKELGYSSAQEITKKPYDCYIEIAAVRTRGQQT